MTPGPAIVPRDGLRDFLPLTPTAVRTFARTHRVKGFLSVYQSGKGGVMGMPVTVRILNDRGDTVLDLREALEASRFAANRSAGYLFELPLSRLQPGPYLLTVQVQNGPAAVRHVRFTVQ